MKRMKRNDKKKTKKKNQEKKIPRNLFINKKYIYS